LAKRKQRVVVGAYVSELLDVLSGVPQGSVLGPLLFLISINDMPSLVHHFCKLFADDTKLIAIIRNAMDTTLLQEDIDRLVAWSETLGMCFNEDKCKVMHIDKRQQQNVLNTTSKPKFTMTDQHSKVHTLEESSVGDSSSSSYAATYMSIRPTAAMAHEEP
jgi:hypothetical protein